jgi:hypothetical protein
MGHRFAARPLLTQDIRMKSGKHASEKTLQSSVDL